MDDRYGSDVLARDPHGSRKVRSTEIAAERGLVVEDAETGYVGAVVRIEFGRVELEDRHGRRRPFPMGPGFLIDGKPVILTTPRKAASGRSGQNRIGFGCGARESRSRRAAQSHLRRGAP